MLGRDERPQRAVVGPGIGRDQGLGLLLQGCDEALEDGALDIDPLGAEANLPAIREHRPCRAFDRRIEIRIGEDDGRILAAELERERLHGVGGGFHDGCAGPAFAGEGERIDARVTGEPFARRIRSETVNDVEDARGHADRVHHLGEQRRRRRRLLGRLGDHRVPARECWRDLPREQEERQVPGRNDADHAMGLSHRVVERSATIGRIHLEAIGSCCLHQVGEQAKVGRAARNIDLTRD